MIAWRDLPATVPSEVEGWRYLAWQRVDVRINGRDTMARMPKKNRAAVSSLSYRAKSFAILIGFIPGLQGIEIESIGT